LTENLEVRHQYIFKHPQIITCFKSSG